MAIRPQFASAIFNGTKSVEFRRRPLASDIATVIVYVTQPTGRIVGAFDIAHQRIASPQALWRRYRTTGGIDRAPFFDYYEGVDVGVAIEISSPRVLCEPVDLADVGPGLAVPQSYRYVAVDMLPVLAPA
jgi:predicted transcriptional regulator